jgi:hypothetical protein
MNKKELFFRVSLVPTIIFILIYGYTIFFFADNEWWSEINGNNPPSFLELILSPFINIFFWWNTSYSYSDVSFILSLFSLISLFFFLYSLFLGKRYLGFPSIKEAKNYYKEKDKLEKKQRMQKAIHDHKIRLEQLDEEKKKYL